MILTNAEIIRTYRSRGLYYKHYGLVIFKLRSKLVCFMFDTVRFPKLAGCPSRKTLIYHQICPFQVNYESVMLYSTGSEEKVNGFVID
jgi:hypothetical protein